MKTDFEEDERRTGDHDHQRMKMMAEANYRAFGASGSPGADQLPRVAIPGALPETEMRYWRVSMLRSLDELRLSYALRCRVYCEERGFLALTDYPDGVEKDEFDDHSLHFGSFDGTGEMVGSARLVLRGPRGFPMFNHCTIEPQWQERLEGIPTLVEISRLVVSRQYRRRANDGYYGIQAPGNDVPDRRQAERDQTDRRQQFSVAISLFKGMYHAAWHLKLTHALSAMELTLLRLLQRYHFPFEKIGPQCDYFGPVTPFILDVAQTEQRLAADAPDLLQEFHQGLDASEAAALVV